MEQAQTNYERLFPMIDTMTIFSRKADGPVLAGARRHGGMVGLIMRLFSFVFHFLLGLVMAAIGFVALVSNQHTLRIGVLPWTGSTLTYCLFFLGLAGMAITALAVKRIVPLLFLVWSLAVLVMIVRGYFLSSYNFGMTGVDTALYLTGAAILALIGSALQMRAGYGSVRRRQSVLA
jgi:hypothetical protein